MYRHHRPSRLGIALVSGALMVAIATPVSGQLVVYDAATTARNTITAAVKEFLFETERQQHTKIREMARRLSALTNLEKYAIEEVPRWRTHGGDFFYAQPYNDALIFGDSSGSAFTELSHQLAGILTLFVEGQAHAQAKFGIILKEGVAPGRATSLAVIGPGCRGQVTAIDTGTAGGIGNDHPIPKELAHELEVGRLATAGAGPGKLKQRFQELDILNVVEF